MLRLLGDLYCASAEDQRACKLDLYTARSYVTPVEILQNTISDRTHCIAQLRPGSSFLLSVLRFFDRPGPEGRSGGGIQPIHYAVSAGPIDALQFLYEQGVDLASSPTYTGKTPIDFAMHGAAGEGAYVKTVQWLRDHMPPPKKKKRSRRKKKKKKKRRKKRRKKKKQASQQRSEL